MINIDKILGQILGAGQALDGKPFDGKSLAGGLLIGGLAAALAQGLLAGLHDWPVYAALLVVFLFTTLLTEVMSNAATVAMVIPIAGQLAQGLDQPPMAFIYAVLFGASQSFLSPVGYQTNLMIYGPGGYKFSDYVRFGGPLNLLVMAITVALAPLIWPF